jgi:gamma-glutamylcyclotransferase (GGCT)/AIG2-like uncharacterized protein YtfP
MRQAPLQPWRRPVTAWRRTEPLHRAARTITNSTGQGSLVAGPFPGRLTNAGWGASLGYPALILDPDGSAIQVHVFESTDLPAHWSRLDQFEGPGYQRVLTSVHTPLGQIDALIYALPARDQGLTAGRTPVQLRRARRAVVEAFANQWMTAAADPAAGPTCGHAPQS